jgi:hypothetical protein
MYTDTIQAGIPQTEEDIEAVTWVNQDALAPYLENTYDNIKEVMEAYLTSKHQ